MRHVRALEQAGEVAPKVTCSKVVVCAPKGGVGKTTIVRSLLVSASKSGVKAIGINLDEQTTLSRWSTLRTAAREKFPEIVPVDVWQGQIDDFQRLLNAAEPYQIAFIDTPPGHGAYADSIASLCERADLIIIPTSSTNDDLDEVIPFQRRVAGAKGVFVMNKVNRRTTSFLSARHRLISAGALCPIEIPQLEDIHKYFTFGLTALDAPKADGVADLDAVWQFVWQQVHR